MKVSIVVPTFNEQECIENCLKSMASQNLPSFEIIVVDGGSSDRTIEIAEKYADKVYNLKKRGIGIARVFGAKKARGKYYYMTDADCWANPGLLKNFYSLFEKNNFAAITGPTKYFGINGKIMQNWYYFFDKIYFKKKYGVYGLSGRNTMVDRKVFLKAVGKKKVPNFWEDGFFSFELKRFGDFLYSDKLFNFSFERRLRNPLFIMKTIITYYKGMREFKKSGTIKKLYLPK